MNKEILESVREPGLTILTGRRAQGKTKDVISAMHQAASLGAREIGLYTPPPVNYLCGNESAPVVKVRKACEIGKQGVFVVSPESYANPDDYEPIAHELVNASLDRPVVAEICDIVLITAIRVKILESKSKGAKVLWKENGEYTTAIIDEDGRFDWVPGNLGIMQGFQRRLLNRKASE